MTIVAGFKVKEGIVLCADTKFTGAMNLYQPKLFEVDLKDGDRLIFGLSGPEATAQTAIDLCTDELKGLKREHHSVTRVKVALRRVVKQVTEEYVYVHPRHEREPFEFELMIGAWLSCGGGAQLFWTSGAAVNVEPNYTCIGTGSYLGRYVIAPAFRRNEFSERCPLENSASGPTIWLHNRRCEPLPEVAERNFARQTLSDRLINIFFPHDASRAHYPSKSFKTIPETVMG